MGTRLRHVGPSLSSCLLLLLQLLLPFPSAADPHSSPPHHANFHPSKAVVITGTILTFILFLCLLSFFLQRCRPSDTSRRRPLVARRWAAASRRGLDAEVVESFPTMVYSEVKGLKAEGRSAGKLECAVCLCEFEDEDTLRLLPKCSHAFHPECIGMWLESHITCPVCRANLKDLATVPAQAPPPSSCTLPGAEGAEPSQAENDGGEQITRESVVISVDDGDDETGRAAVHDGSSSWTEEEQERFTLRLPESTREGVTGRELRRSMTIAVVRKSGFGEEGEGISGVEKGAKASSTRSDRWAFLARTFSLRGFNGAGAGAGVGHPGDKGEEESPADGIV